jgi:PAS domain S-box-containing protein
LRYFLPVVAAAVLVFIVMNGASHGRIPPVLSSFLILLLSLIVVVCLSLLVAEVVGRRIERPLKERELFMRLLQAVTASCNGAETLAEALPLVLKQVCRLTGWPVGHAWIPRADGKEFVSGPWHLSDPARFASFRSHSDRLRFPPDQGLPARVLASGESRWTPDFSADKEFPHRQEVKDARLAAGYAFPVKWGGKAAAVFVFFSERTGDPSAPCRETLEAIGVQLERVAERERAERSLRHSEQRFRSVTQTANDAIVSYDAAGVLTGWNRGAKTIFGFDEGDIIGRSLARIVPDSSPSAASPAGFPRDFLTDTAGKTLEFAGLRKDGGVFPIEVSVASWESDGKAFFAAVMRDVTRRKNTEDTLTASLREKEAMLQEIHHRVKNNLQIISSLLRLQSEKIQDPALRAVFLESQNRVRSMAIIHECLYQSPDLARMDFSDYVEKLTDSLLRTYGVPAEKRTLRLDVDKGPLSLDVAIPCGLIITELVSNALKYAYPEGQEGDVFVGFRVLPEYRYELTVADRGVGLKGPVNFETTDSLGLRLVHILTKQLRGRIFVANGVGARFTVTFKDPETPSKMDGGKT